MNIGETAPDFTLKDAAGRDWRLADHRGRVVVLLFYPGDNTPVCTKQLCSVRDNWEAYRQTGAEVVGISTDSVASHKAFAEHYSLPLTLLADEKGEVVRLYEARSWLPGRAARAVVVIDKNGRLVHRKVQPLSVFRPKDDEVLEVIRQAQTAA